MVGAGWAGALLSGLMNEIARWLWPTFFAAVSTGRAPWAGGGPKVPGRGAASVETCGKGFLGSVRRRGERPSGRRPHQNLGIASADDGLDGRGPGVAA